MNKWDVISMLFLGLTIVALLHENFDYAQTCVFFFMVNSSMSRIERMEKKNRKGDNDA